MRMRKKPKPMRTILPGIPGHNAWAGIKHKKYEGELQDFKGQLRCHTGVQDLGKDRIILIKPHQLDSKREKYPSLRVLETVQ